MKRVIITITGCVQGVGFRPFVYRLAHLHGLTGNIRNTNIGVIIDVQGRLESLKNFQDDLSKTKPERAFISNVKTVEAPLHDAQTFAIHSSETENDPALALLPDTAVCPMCLQELFDPANRRYRYPFLHCVGCGPRFSLFLRMPFDRSNTIMTDFDMCQDCTNEYKTPNDRRFYSQTNCCPACGPELVMLDSKGKAVASHNLAFELAVEYLQKGMIVALKNTGGYLLLADASNPDAVQNLRRRKRRPTKPLALLMPGIASIKQIAMVCPTAEQVLNSAAAPIVLLNKNHGPHGLAESVAPDSPYYGVMLPHNPIQHLLMHALSRPLVATSGNASGMPLCITEEEAFSQLGGIADAFLVHNRKIMHRLDDSIVQIVGGRPMLNRRARGYTPFALDLPQTLQLRSGCLLGAGSQMKNSFALAKGGQIYLSQHMGNLETLEACRAYDRELESWQKLLAVKVSEGVGDIHPEYYTTQYLSQRNLLSDAVQHHEAHVWAGMMDNQMEPPLLALAMDGTGLGYDNTIWGCEAFIVKEEGMQRFATLYPFCLPGGEKAIREPRRTGLGLLHSLSDGAMPQACRPWVSSAFSEDEIRILSAAIVKGINSPLCRSMGRLFDAVSALLGICQTSGHEGHAAMALEARAMKATANINLDAPELKRDNRLYELDWRPMIKQLLELKGEGVDVSNIALAFHDWVVRGIVAIAQATDQEKILLTGGVWQNRLLAEKAIVLLRQAGFKPFWHIHVPPNDGGLAVGQIAGKLFRSKDQNLPCDQSGSVVIFPVSK